MKQVLLSILVLLVGVGGVRSEKEGGLKPGESIDYGSIAFFPKRWEEKKINTRMIPWEGKEIVLLTNRGDLDPKTIAIFLNRLDAGWKLYADMVGKTPERFRQVMKKAPIAAIPDAGLSCGYGCGYVGATGIEVAGFYDVDFPMVSRNPAAFPHYYFYEMGRNYYLFGARHSLFITGYAVFMRYVCMDALRCEDPERAMRKKIEDCEAEYAKSNIGFLKALTTLDGLDEKAPRFPEYQGPNDQPVIYCAMMLKLRADYGGDAWVKRFFRFLMQCPEIKPNNKEAALKQSLNWLVAASLAAKKDLTPLFVDRWRFPLSDKTRKALNAIDWAKENQDPSQLISRLPTEFLPH